MREPANPYLEPSSEPDRNVYTLSPNIRVPGMVTVPMVQDIVRAELERLVDTGEMPELERVAEEGTE